MNAMLLTLKQILKLILESTSYKEFDEYWLTHFIKKNSKCLTSTGCFTEA